MKCSTQQGTWEKLVSDMMSNVLSALVTALISKRFYLMLPSVILILIRSHYSARSSWYSTERCSVKSFGRSTGAQSLSSPVAQRPCWSERTTLKRAKGRLRHAARMKEMVRACAVKAKIKSRFSAVVVSVAWVWKQEKVPKFPGVATRGMFAWSTACFCFPLSMDLLYKLKHSKQ